MLIIITAIIAKTIIIIIIITIIMIIIIIMILRLPSKSPLVPLLEVVVRTSGCISPVV